MDENAFALDIVVRGRERVCPRHKRVVGAQRADAVVTFRVIGGEIEIVRVELDGLAIQFQRLVKNLLFVDAVKGPRVLAEQINRVAKF